MSILSTQAINAIRILSVDQVQKANSGHPGCPLGAAPIIAELYSGHLKHSPGNPAWVNRDRFVLSAGHASAMLYSTLHLFGYPQMGKADLEQFRQFGSNTPGHPEYWHTPGVEATTGPLGAGLGMAVGMAIAEAHLAAEFNKPDMEIIDHYTYSLCGEGCLMEGISSEVLSLAGTLGLGKLIILFDSNDITIEGPISIAFRENVMARMEAFGFQTLTVEDGNDTNAIGAAIEEARSDLSRPSFIKVKTTIGYGVPDRQGTAKSHGEPIGEANVPVLRENLGWEYPEPFFVPESVYEEYAACAARGDAMADEWEKKSAEYHTAYPDDAALLDSYFAHPDPEALFPDNYYEFEPKADATRSISGKIQGELAVKLTNLFGGSADLAPSNKTSIKDAGSFSLEDRRGRNMHFGVREMGMAAIGNGIALHGGLIPFVSTFFVFTDYLKPMLRLSALMKVNLTYILTHDSIGVGEDGPTHQPVEQLTTLRATPGVKVFRPADEFETRAAWKHAITGSGPTAIVLSRQTLPLVDGTGKESEKGAYVVHLEPGREGPDAVLIATGSELAPACEAAMSLEAEGYHIRVVSMPCMEVFESQDRTYRDSVIPPMCPRRVAVEAGSSMSWGRYVGSDGAYVTMDGFGASAPAPELFEHFGINADNIAEVTRNLLKR